MGLAFLLKSQLRKWGPSSSPNGCDRKTVASCFRVESVTKWEMVGVKTKASMSAKTMVRRELNLRRGNRTDGGQSSGSKGTLWTLCKYGTLHTNSGAGDIG